jgi:NADPH-dependent F420 reductase
MKLAFIGGTGPEGMGLALRFAKAGHEIIIGSRQAERAQEAARAIRERVPNARAAGCLNHEAAREGEVVFLTVPYQGQRETLPPLREALDSKVIVDTIAPLHFDKGTASALPVEEGSAAEQAQKLVPEGRVVGSFHNLSARELANLDHSLEGDVIVVSDDKEAKQLVMELARQLSGVRAVDGGRLANARYVENLTALLLNINRIYKANTTIKVVGI